MNLAGMRLLLTTDAVGGVWQYSLELAGSLATRGVRVILLVLGPPPTAAQRLEARVIRGVKLIETGLPLDWLSPGPDEVHAAGRAIAALATEERADLVQLNMPTLGSGARFAAPVIAVTHGCVGTWWEAAERRPLPPAFEWHRNAMAKGLSAADCVLAPSASYAATVARYYGLAKAPIVVPNGRSPHPAPPGAPVQDSVLTVGRLWDRVKNAALLDRVAGRLAIPFHAAGAITGPHGECTELTHLHALGHLETAALEHYLATRPVFVSAATFEPFGLAVLEAAAAGCALVLSDIATFRELWDDAAIFVPPLDDDAYLDAIETIIGDTPLRQRLGEDARKRALRFTPERTADRMMQVYASTLSNRTSKEQAAA